MWFSASPSYSDKQWLWLLFVMCLLGPFTPAHAQVTTHEALQLEECGLENPKATLDAVSIVPPKDTEVSGIGATGLPVVRRARALLEGSLLGKTVYVSPGHGWKWNGSSWRTQRGNNHGIVEDLISTEVATQYLVKYLRNMGAYVVTLRENDLNINIAISDDAHESFSTVGTVTLREESKGYAIPSATYAPDHRPFRAGSSKVFDASSDEDFGVRWTFDVPEDGLYNIYVGYVQAPDRASDARYIVRHAGGQSEFHVDQRRHGNTWVFLGNFYFVKGSSSDSGSLELNGHSDDAAATLSADVARIGGGLSQIAQDGNTSGRPAFEDSALNYLQSAGAPSSVLVNDVQARSRFAAWDHEEGEDAVYISWHTNAFDGSSRGTSSFAYGPTSFGSIDTFSGVDGSVELLTSVHNELLEDLRLAWDSDWPEFGSGLYAAYFGEVNPSNNPEMPAGLFEIAFHDNATDANALADPRFRRIAGRAMAQGVARYFADRDSAEVVFPPDEPRAIAIEQEGDVLRIHWQSPRSESGGGDAATRYRVYLSSDGLAFDDGHDVSTTSYEIIGSEAQFARVTALNAGGESFPSAIVGGRASEIGKPQVLIVNDFARLDSGQLIDDDLSDFELDHVRRMLLHRMNDFSHTARYGRAIDASGVSFASTSVQALRDGSVSLTGYTLVIWMAGETQEDLLATEDLDMLRVHLASGGLLLLSGTDVATALSTGANESQAFLRDTLAIAEVEDDAQSFSLSPDNGPLATIGPMRFDDGDVHGYLAEDADRLEVGPAGQALLTYTEGGVAASMNGNAALLAFPFETIVGEEDRVALMAALLNAFALSPDEPPNLGEPEEPDPTKDKTGGCGCDSSGSRGAAGTLLFILLAFGLWRRSGSGSTIL